MPLRLYLILLTSFLPIIGECGDTSVVKTYFGAYIGGTYNQGLTDFNNDLVSNSVQQVPEFVFTLGFDYGILFNRSKITFNFNGETIGNKSKPPNTKISMGCTAISINYGFDLAGKNEFIRIEPFLGIGGSAIEFYALTHDTTATFSQVTSGAQNLYSERPSFGFFLDSGIRFDLFPKKKDPNRAFFGQINYQMQLNKHEWEIEGMSLSSISKLNFAVGIKFQVRMPRKRHTTY